MADTKKPYGNVDYADPGYREGVKRYPLDSEEHCKAAWAYINMSKNAKFYNAEQLKSIKGRIMEALEKYGVEVSDEAREMGAAAVSLDDDAAALLASVAPLAPPSAWFANPNLKAPTPLTIDDDGHVFGHLAQWKVCHVGVGNKCVMAPKTRTNYQLFRVGTVRTDDGKTVPIGKITLGTGHASDRWGIMPSREHYDNTGWAAAIVNVGEDRHGIWISGSLTTTMTPERTAELRASSLSGDWREVNYNLELIAALAVNSPGFPIYREQGGQAFSLMAVGVIGQEEEYMDEEAEFSVEEMEEATGFAAAKDADVADEEVDQSDGEAGDEDDDGEDDDDAELSARVDRWNLIEEELEEHQLDRRTAQLAAIDDERMALAEKSERLAEPAGAVSPTAEEDAVFIQYNARFQALAQQE
jgi:hypothetical protein